jgi:Na+/citrate or Na+/malate symporter
MTETGAVAQKYCPTKPSNNWASLAALRVGPMPLPLYVVLCLITVVAAAICSGPRSNCGRPEIIAFFWPTFSETIDGS